MEREFRITGMSCAGCAARVQKCVAALPGVSSVQVNLLTKSMKVSAEGAADADICAAVKRLGFGAEAEETPPPPPPPGISPGWRAGLSALFLVPLAAAHALLPHGVMWSAWVQLAVALPIVWLNRVFFIRGIGALRHAGPSMDTLVALGAGVALADGLVHLALSRPGMVYFESAGMILAFISIGKWLESRATQRTGRALEHIASLLPAEATLLSGIGGESCVPAAGLRPGDRVLVRPGERIPADGTVLQGVSAVDEAALTGESMPVSKTAGARVFAGTLNHHGALQVKVDRAREDYALSEVMRLVRDAAAHKAPMARLADKLAAVFVPVVLALALATAVCWALAGETWEFAVARAVAVLVISCPCALGLATPVAIMAGAGRGAEGGILFRSGEALEAAGRVSCTLLDKTGTLTSGVPCVTDVLPQHGSREELLQLAAALEGGSQHPLAKAILSAAPPAPVAAEHTYLPGRGVRAYVQGELCAAGNAAFMRELGVRIPQEPTELMAAGKTLLHIARGSVWMGCIAVADAPRPGAAAAVQALRSLGQRVLMATGDHALTAQAIASGVGVSEVLADALPADKAELVRRLQGDGERVAMVGDGVNDAPALTAADVGIAIGAGTDVAIESAGIILMHSDPQDIPRALALSRAILRKIRQNLFLAFIYNLLAIPLAAGVFYHPFGILLPPAVSAIAMGLSSLSVTLNALLLRRA